MTLPLSRNTTYAANAQVKSVDLNAIQDQIVALYAAATAPKTKFPTPIVATNWAAAYGALGSSTATLDSSGSGSAYVDLGIPQGHRLSTLTLACVGNASANLTIGVLKVHNDTASNDTSLGALVLSALSATEADQTLNMLASSTGLTVTVATGGGNVTYTRSAGSFITDGLFIGQIVAWTGFVNGGNNQTITITALSATVMTALIGTGTAESGPAAGAAVNGVSPLVDSTFALQLKLTASATGLAVKALRYTTVPS